MISVVYTLPIQSGERKVVYIALRNNVVIVINQG